MLKILYFYPNFSSFVKKDLDIFKIKFEVECFEFNPRSKWKTPFVFLMQFIFILKNVGRNTVFITQFAGYQSFIPVLAGKILRINNFIVLGGTDCNWLPSVHYGNYNKPLLKQATRFSLKHASHLLPVNKELVYCTYSYTDKDFPFQGYKYFFPDIETGYSVIPNGIDPAAFFPDGQNNRKSLSVVTTCSELQDERRRLIKGIDLIVNFAENNADYSVTIIGGSFPKEMKVPDNVHTIPFVENSALPHLYNQFQFYFQLSLTEGFPNALIEAMACGCVPVVSNVGAMPDIVGDEGYVLEKKDVGVLSGIMTKAMENYSSEQVLKVSRKAASFDLKVREDALLEVISNAYLNKVTSP